ncbi:MAG: Mth938-like domain-containing protein [Rhodospirillaceae bacterium]
MPGLDVTPVVPEGRKAVQSYGGGRFRVSGDIFESSILLTATACRAWEVSGPGWLDADRLAADIAALAGTGGGETSTMILVIGCGARFSAPPAGFRDAMKAKGYGVEWMDTGAACRTFNVLMGEGRPVAAAIIAID